jgi:hypothetical protein
MTNLIQTTCYSCPYDKGRRVDLIAPYIMLFGIVLAWLGYLIIISGPDTMNQYEYEKPKHKSLRRLRSEAVENFIGIEEKEKEETRCQIAGRTYHKKYIDNANQ